MKITLYKHPALMALLFSTGCQAQALHPAQARHEESASTIVLDGEFSDWVDQPDALGSTQFISIHFAPKNDHPQTIQAAPYTTRIRIDADNDPHTGRPMRTMQLDSSIRPPQGVDLLVELSPKNEQGTIGIGSAVTRYAQQGAATALGHADLGFEFLPTYQSPQYEARIDRLAPGAGMLRQSGTISIVVDQIDKNGGLLWSSAPMVVDLPPSAEPTPVNAVIPPKPSRSVRVMSSNVLFSSPLKNPEPFERVLGAIDPDVILYQEWFNTPADEVQRWLNAHAGTGWRVHMPDSKAGVAIATTKPIITTYQAVIPPSGNERPARAVAALIDTDAGELLAISVHLKCCGNAGSEEDLKRIDQAKSINAFVRSVHKKHPDAKVVIAGDFNLVGSRTPLDTIRASLGIHGEDLSTVNTIHIGERSMITWNDEKSRFSPGRLDWMLIDESMSTPAHAFILDTRTLSDGSLEAMGLHPDDSKGSDHLPIVMDLAGIK